VPYETPLGSGPVGVGLSPQDPSEAVWHPPLATAHTEVISVSCSVSSIAEATWSRSDDGRTGDGAGLGLSIVKAVAELHGGNVRASNRPTGGADVRIRRPADPAEPRHPRPDAATASPTSARHRVPARRMKLSRTRHAAAAAAAVSPSFGTALAGPPSELADDVADHRWADIDSAGLLAGASSGHACAAAGRRFD
jgi:hypothetical protein